jgi:hypothetical protein
MRKLWPLYGASPPVSPRNKRPFNKKARIARGCDGAILRISDRIDMTLTMRIGADFRRQGSDTFPFLAFQLTQLLQIR